MRVLCYWRDRVPNALDLLKTAINDEAPRVRLEAIRALSFFNGTDAERAQDITFDIDKHEKDYYIDYCAKETMKQLQTLVLPKDPTKLEQVLAKMSADDLKSRKPTEAILEARLARKEYDIAYRGQVIADLAAMRKTDNITEIIAAFQRLDAKSNDAAANELVKVLISSSAADLTNSRAALLKLARESKRGPARKAGWAAIVTADGKTETAWTEAASAKDREALVTAIPSIIDPSLRGQFQPKLAELATSASGGTLKAVLNALPLMGAQNAKVNFAVLAKHVIEGKERNAAGAAIMALPRASWDKGQSDAVAGSILAYARTLDENKRTQQDFVELNQLGMELASLAGNNAMRKELRGLGVPVFVVKTVREQMRYDTQRIVVEAGKPFEIILQNEDAMPHNLVIVDPGQHVAASTAAMTMTINDVDRRDKRKRQFLPKGFHILDATALVEPEKKESLKLTSPNKEGDYEYVCTFPGHGILMWGVLAVTKDVDVYLNTHPTFTLPAPGAPTAPAATK